MEDTKRSFVLYCDYKQHIDRLTDEQAGRLFKSIFDYCDAGLLPDLEPAAAMAFSFISSQLDRDKEKYEKKKAAAAARWNAKQSAMQNDASRCSSMQVDAVRCKSMQTDADACTSMQNRFCIDLHSDNVTVTDNVNDTVTVTDTVTDNVTGTVTDTVNDNVTNNVSNNKKEKDKPASAGRSQRSQIDIEPYLTAANLSDPVKDKVREWITYKHSIREPYKEIGLHALIEIIEKHYQQYGSEAVCGVILEAISNHWKGIQWKNIQKHQNSADRISVVDTWV